MSRPPIDPRLLQIMAQLEQGAGIAAPEPTQVKPPAEERIKPPTTYEEFIKVEKIDEWPLRITSETLDLEDERLKVLGSRDQIADKLRKSAPIKLQRLDDLEKSLGALEVKLMKYANHILEAPKHPSSETSSSKAFITETAADPVSDIKESTRKNKEKQKELDHILESRKKTVEYCSFPGFRIGELTELPGQVEGPQILHRVTKAQDFNPGFRKFWKKIFLSEASVAVLQDAFWWLFLDCFDNDRKVDQDSLFDRIADSFVALFTSINPEVKDKFFQVYPDCLAQAIFMSFYETFPESEKHFQDEFKQKVVNVLSEWISGTHPVPNTWQKWNMKRLEPKRSGADLHKIATPSTVDKEVKQSLDIEGFERMVHKLGSPTGSRGSNLTPLISRDITRLTTGTLQPQPPTPRLFTTPRVKTIESHQAGPGPDFQRVMFNVQGRSPLVAHYLNIHQLQSEKHIGSRLKRTEISKLPPPGPTYKDLIDSTVAMSDALNREYQKICDQADQDILKIERNQRDMNREVDKLQKEFQHAKNVIEIKILSEKIMEKKDQETPRKSKRENKKTKVTIGEEEEGDTTGGEESST